MLCCGSKRDGKVRIKCRKCLLSEIGEEELLKSLDELRRAIPKDKRCEEGLYNRRLAICKECDKLNGGMCTVCGCYIEFRALKADGYCPDIAKKW